MAHRIKAINAYRPRLEQGNTVQKPELIRAVSRATGIVEGTLDQNIKELRDQIIEYCRAGRAVKVEGLGTWTPTIALDGTLDIQYRPDPAFNYGLNIPASSAAPLSTARTSARPAKNSSKCGIPNSQRIRSSSLKISL